MNKLSGYRCYLTVKERSYLQMLVQRDMKGIDKKNPRKIRAGHTYAKLEDLFPDEDRKTKEIFPSNAERHW